MDETLVQVRDNKGKALASLILGLVGIIAWIIPILGLPVTIVGLVMGILGRKSTRKGMAIAGIILSVIFLIAALVNSVLGAYLAISALS